MKKRKCCLTDSALALHAEHLPFEFLLWEGGERVHNVTRNINSAGEAYRLVSTPRNGHLAVRKIKSEYSSDEEDTIVSVPRGAGKID